jgi:hypothetical protein
MAANATALLSIRVAADLDETIALVKSVVGKHEGVKLTIEVSLPPVPLDSDVGGFQTIVVSYFTVLHPYVFLTCRMFLICAATSSDISMDLEGATS